MSAPTTYKNATKSSTPQPGNAPLLERLFRLTEHRTTVRVEVMAGLTTFFASVFTVLAIPGMMAGGAAAAVGDAYASAGIANAVYIAAVLSSLLGSLLMAFLANLPFVQAPGMGLGSYLAFTVMPAIGVLAAPDTLSAAQVYQMALALVFVSGALFVLLSATGVRQRIIDGIPHNIKVALGTGIGLFVTLLGLRQAGITVGSAGTFVTLVDFSAWNGGDDAARTLALGAVVAIAGFLVMAVLHARQVKGAILLGIVVTTALAYLTGHTRLPEGFGFDVAGQWSDFATYSLFTLDFATFGRLGNLGHVLATALAMVLAHTLVNSLDSLGTIFGVASAAGMVDKRGNVVGLEKGLLSDAIGTAGGALLGSSSTATVVSSASGINAGGRTGLTALVTSGMFALALVAAPLVPLIPVVATAPALIFVGCLMMTQVKDVDFRDVTEGVPAFLAIAIMPLTFSIANGIAFALISYVVLKAATGRHREIRWPAAAIAALFVLQFLV